MAGLIFVFLSGFLLGESFFQTKEEDSEDKLPYYVDSIHFKNMNTFAKYFILVGVLARLPMLLLFFKERSISRVFYYFLVMQSICEPMIQV